MKFVGGVCLTVITLLATFSSATWVGSRLLSDFTFNDPPPAWLVVAVLTVPALLGMLASVFVWMQLASTGETLEGGRSLRTGVWTWYLTTGAVLAVTRVALFVWVVHQNAKHIYTETIMFIGVWLYPEGQVAIFWTSLQRLHGAKFYLAWCSLFTIASFVVATPIPLVGWLRHTRTLSGSSR